MLSARGLPQLHWATCSSEMMQVGDPWLASVRFATTVQANKNLKMCFTDAHFTVELCRHFGDVVMRHQVLHIITSDLFTCQTLHVNRNLITLCLEKLYHYTIRQKITAVFTSDSVTVILWNWIENVRHLGPNWYKQLVSLQQRESLALTFPQQKMLIIPPSRMGCKGGMQRGVLKCTAPFPSNHCK